MSESDRFNPAPRREPRKYSSGNKGLKSESGNNLFEALDHSKGAEQNPQQKDRNKKFSELAREIMEEHLELADTAKPFMGAQPKLLKQPQIASKEDTRRATIVASQAICLRIQESKSVLVICGHDSSFSKVTRNFFEGARDDKEDWDEESAPVMVAMGRDWQNTLPFAAGCCDHVPPRGDRLLIYVGTPGKYAAMCIRSDHGKFEEAYQQNKLIVLCKGVCMLPLGTQEENILGVDEAEILSNITTACRQKGTLAWGHGAGTKATFMQKAFGYPIGESLPPPMQLMDQKDIAGFDYFTQYTAYLNQVKLAKPELTVRSYYDTGLTVSVMMGAIVSKGVSLLTDGDGLAMLRDASIGHTMSKFNQVLAVKPFSSTRAVYNFYIGDGACRLNGGVELALHLLEGQQFESMTTLFIFNNYKWAIEDNLVADTEKEHALFNHDFYDLVGEHDKVCICDTELELCAALSYLSTRTDKYVKGEAGPALQIVVVRGLMQEMPPVLGDIDPIRQSKEMAFLRKTLGTFAKGCEQKVPIYGCSAFEYIQYLHIFMEEMPEGKKYQYVCGRTDIQAAHMAGFHQPEGKCCLFINDVYGVNSLGESLRFILSGFGGRQVLVIIWHPTLIKVIDHFHLHRPPMVWPSLGPTLAKYYVRKESDALFVDFEGEGPVQGRVDQALKVGTPLVVVNMMPEQECSYISLDCRVKAVSSEIGAEKA